MSTTSPFIRIHPADNVVIARKQLLGGTNLAGENVAVIGLVLDSHGAPLPGEPIIARAYQEHGEVRSEAPLPMRPLGARLRVAPNHTCLTAAAHDRYHVVDGGDEVLAVWDRVNGW